MKYILIAVTFLSFGASADEYLGQLTDNPYAANSITSPTSTYQAKPYSATPPKLYNSQGELLKNGDVRVNIKQLQEETKKE